MTITIAPTDLLALVIFLLVIGVLYKHYFLPYLSKKGENLATKEDVAKITDEVARANHPYSVLLEEFRASNALCVNSLLEELKGRHQLRLAAVDKRLQVHQEAFTLWRKMLEFAYDDEVGKVVLEAQAWWEKNCIYLEPSVRMAFVNAYSAVHTHGNMAKNRADPELLKDNWNRFTSFHDILFKAVELPALSELEAKRIELSETKQ